MLFNSFDFLIFFPLVTIGYFLLPQKARNLWLLAASCYFYMAFVPVYILILLVTIVVDYFAGIALEKTANQPTKKLLLVLSLAANVGFLSFFKYGGFISQNLHALAQFLHWNYSEKTLEILLPIGLSFHTFQAMAYTIEVYRGRQKAERNFFIYALYVMFYPQLVAGPIERPQNLIPQFYEKHAPDYERITHGLRLMLWGFFKKLVIADRTAALVNQVFSHPQDYHGLPVWIAMYFFAFQIYCDFSGYSDIAIGAAEVMGFRLMKNFNQPYLSQSVTEFWKRWHISLSTWFRDYVYIPLGGNRVSRFRWRLNILAVFALSGLWHGANWTYVVWGLLHGFFMMASRVLKKIKSFPALRVFITFHAVCFAWIFFRASSVRQAVSIFLSLFTGLAEQLTHPASLAWQGKMLGPFYLALDSYNLGVAVAAIISLFVFYRLQRHSGNQGFLAGRPLWARWTVYYLAIGAVIFLGFDRSSQFIYFQF